MRIRRGKAIKLDGTVVTFLCPNGHESKKDYSKGKRHKRISEKGLQLLINNWKDGISFECRKCKKLGLSTNY